MKDFVGCHDAVRSVPQAETEVVELELLAPPHTESPAADQDGRAVVVATQGRISEPLSSRGGKSGQSRMMTS